MRLGSASLGAFVLLAGCASGETGFYGGRMHSSSVGYAAANVAVGAALYVAAGGCKIAGCPTNTKCNVVTERCDPIKCYQSECKADEVCDEAREKCIPATFVVTPGSKGTTTPAVPSALNTGPGTQN